MPPEESTPEFEMDAGDSAVPEPAAEPVRQSRRFRAWGAAQSQEAKPSLWHRASQGIKGLFIRPKPPADLGIETEADVVIKPAAPEEEPLVMWTGDEPSEVAATEAHEELSMPVSQSHEGPKEDLKFLRTMDPDVPPDMDFAAIHEGPTDPMDPPAEPQRPPKKKRASLLKRVFLTPIVFGPKAKKLEDEDVPDTDENAVAALDEALPMDSASAGASEFGDPVYLDAEPEPPKKVGFFAKLFGRKAKAPPPMEIEAEPQAEPDAVEQLDAVDEGFEAARSEFAPPEHDTDRSFATVEEALPFAAPTVDEQPAVTEASFEPPPVEAAATPATPVSDEHSFFGGNTFDFDTPKPDDRSTMEVAPVDDRKTAEVTPDLAAHADEVGRKTDEFELLDMGTLQEPAVSPLEGKTAEVPKVGLFKKLFSRTKEVTAVEPAVAPPPSANPTFLVQKFRTFYNEVVVYKNQKAELTAGFATAIVTSYDADLSPEQAATSLSQRLQQMLELQLAESSWMGGEIQELYPNAQYAMAVLADEMLTNMEWPGQAAWGRHRLELTVFKTAGSDLELFKRIDKLLKNGPQTIGTRDLARVYLLAIASGFKGKYRPFDLPRALAEYRRRLYEFVYDGDALLLYSEERRIFPEAVSVTVAGRGVKRFSMAQQWAAILVLLLVGYTVVSHLAWKKVSADLKDIAGRVEQARNPTPPELPNGGGGR